MKKNRLATSSRRRRGAAMVELAVLMLVFVPLVLLPMYFQDAMRYKLDLQEAVTSAVWDFALQDYTQNDVGGLASNIAQDNHAYFKNLWSGNEKDPDTHTGSFADFEWEQEESCKNENSDFGSNNLSPLGKNYLAEYGKGGLASCEGSIKVTNHYIPEIFMQNFAEKNLFTPGKNTINYRSYRFGVLVDPWALSGCDGSTCHWNDGNNDYFAVEKTGDGDLPAQQFYERSEFLWKKPFTFLGVTLTWAFFNIKALMIDPKPIYPPLLFDNLLKMKMNAQHLNDRTYSLEGGEGLGGPGDYWTTPYRDGVDDNYQRTLEKRVSCYLGCKCDNGPVPDYTDCN